jgi:hypothetical protein
MGKENYRDVIERRRVRSVEDEVSKVENIKRIQAQMVGNRALQASDMPVADTEMATSLQAMAAADPAVEAAIIAREAKGLTRPEGTPVERWGAHCLEAVNMSRVSLQPQGVPHG